MSTTVRITTPSELAGTIPYLIGFTPDEGSLVYVSVGSGPVARIDMSDDVRDAIDTLAPMWDVHPPERAALVLYTANEPRAMLHASGLMGEIQRRGGQVVAVIRVHDGVCASMFGDTSEEPVDTAPAAAAPFVVNGKAPLGSREDVEAQLYTDEDHLGEAEFEAALEVIRAQGKEALHQAAQDLLAAMHQHLENGTLPDDEVIPTFALALQAKPVRDLAWGELRRQNASQYVDLFLHLYRRCPEETTAPICGLLSFAAWLTGALSPLAWKAAEKALEVEPNYTMAVLCIRALQGAMSPDHWTPLDDEMVEEIWRSLR